MTKKGGISRTANSVSSLLDAARLGRQTREDESRSDGSANESEAKSDNINTQATGARSGTGAMLARHEGGLKGQIEELQRQLEQAGTQKLDPTNIKPSRFYNRFEFDLDAAADADFMRFRESIKKESGNAVPALVHRNEDGTYEVVYGHRRWAACKAEGLELLAHLKEGLTSLQIAKLQLLENSDHKSPSVIDQARQVASQMAQGAWRSQAELAREMTMSEGWASMLMDIAKHIPITAQMAHPNHHKVTYKQAKKIAEVGKTSKNELNKRIDWVREHKSELSAEAATNYMMSGKTTAPIQGNVVVHWTVSGTGATLKVRGLNGAKAILLSSRIEELLKELGLKVEGGN